MRGCGMDEKKCMIVDIFNERKLDVMALSETKLKGEGERMWEGQRVIVSGVSERCRAREGVAVLISGRLWGRVRDYKCISSRLMWVKLRMNGENVVIICVYGPGMEKSANERESFWENLNECIAGFGEDDKIVVLGDMNAKVGDREREGVVGKFGVPGINENGECLVEMCVERGLIVGNTWFDKKLIHKYTWERENGDERSLIDYVLIESKYKSCLKDVSVRRGAAGGMSDHYLVEAKVRVNGYSLEQRKVSRDKKIVKVSELEKEEVREAFKEMLAEEWEKVRNSRLLSVEEEWKTFKECVMTVAARVCGYKRVGRKSKSSEWWDDEIKGLVKDKRKFFERYNQNKSVSNKEEYRMKKQEVKGRVREKKEMSDERVGQRVSENFRENKKLFWSGVNEERKSREQMEVRIKDIDGNVVTEERAVLDRWSEYFEQLLNVDDGRVAVLTDARVNGIDDNVRMQMEVTVDDVRKAVKRLKKGKAPGVDGITSEMLRFGGDSVLEWLTRVCKVCVTDGVVPKEWQRGIIVPLYKGKGDKGDCKNYRGISLLSIPGKVYGRILIERVRGMTEGMIDEEQCGFRRGRGCVDQVFTVKQLSEKYVGKGKDLFVAYMDLEKAYDRIDRDAMWRVLRMYGINGNLLRAIQSLYAESEARVRVCREEGEWFGVKVGLRQGCVMSPWLFNLFMDGVMKEVREKAGEIGASLWDARRNCEWNVEWLMFADDTVLVGDSEQKLQKLVKEFGSVCKRRKLVVNVGKSKVMRIGRGQNENEMNVSLNNRRMEEVECYRYLGVDVSHDGKMNEEVSHRIGEARKVSGALQKLWKNRNMSMEAKVGMYEGIVEPTLLYGCEAWTLNVHERRKVEAVEMSCLRSICGVRRMDRIANVEIRRRCGKTVGVGERMDQGVLRWFGHVERMEGERLVRRVYDSDARGMRGRGRPRKCWIDGTKEVMRRKGLDIQEARVCVQDRNEWRSICRGDRRAVGGLPV